MGRKTKRSRRHLDPNLPVEEHVADLISRMTLQEKASQTVHDAPEIKRPGIPKYDW